jgi:hypothetical protein
MGGSALDALHRGRPDVDPVRTAVLPDAKSLVAVHAAPPQLNAAGLTLALPPKPPVEKPVENSVHAFHGATIRERCPRLGFDRAIGVGYRRLGTQGPRASARQG